MNTQTREGSATAVAGTSKPLPGLFNRLRLSTPQPARSAEPLTRATALSHLVFERPDVDLAVRFLLDFGLEVASREEDRVFLRAAGTAPYVHVVERGPEPRFVGLGLVVASDADLERLAGLPGASAIEARSRSVCPAAPSAIDAYTPLGRIRSTSAWGRGMTWTDTSSPTRRAAAAPASVAVSTA